MIVIFFLSLIQGITEFLPISSSSHLIIISEYLEDHYKFNPSLTDDDPHFSAAEESLARSGKFSDD